MLSELIDQFYLDNQEDREQTKFYISDAGKCPRAIFFKMKQAPKEKMDARILRIFERGEEIHRHIFTILYRLKIGATTEIPIPPQALVSGRADAILCIGGENYVLDIKSINSTQFRYLKNPKTENVYQIQLYLHYFEIKKGLLLYIDKDRQEFKEFIVEYNPIMAENLMNSLAELKERVEADIVPQALVDYPKNWQCNYCQYRAICDLAGPPELGWLSFKDKINKSHSTPGLQQEIPLE